MNTYPGGSGSHADSAKLVEIATDGGLDDLVEPP
jgi:hypothetical protein